MNNKTCCRERSVAAHELCNEIRARASTLRALRQTAEGVFSFPFLPFLLSSLSLSFSPPPPSPPHSLLPFLFPFLSSLTFFPPSRMPPSTFPPYPLFFSPTPFFCPPPPPSLSLLSPPPPPIPLLSPPYPPLSRLLLTLFKVALTSKYGWSTSEQEKERNKKYKRDKMNKMKKKSFKEQ